MNCLFSLCCPLIFWFWKLFLPIVPLLSISSPFQRLAEISTSTFFPPYFLAFCFMLFCLFHLSCLYFFGWVPQLTLSVGRYPTFISAIILLIIIFICFFPCFILLIFSLVCIDYVYFKFLSWLFSIQLTCCMLSSWMSFMETILVGYSLDIQLDI